MLLRLLLLTTPIAALVYWFMAWVGGFRLWGKLPDRVKKLLRKIYPIPTFAMGGGGVLVLAFGAAHGCSYGVHVMPLALRELPASVYLKPDHGRDQKAAKLIAPKLPKEKKKKPEDENPATAWLNQNQFVVFSAGTTTFTCDQSTGMCTSGNIATTGATTFTMTGTRTTSGQQLIGKQELEYNTHMAASFPPSEPPSKCVATCVNCHSNRIKKTWVTLVEERYCDGDHSDDDSMTLGWLKVGDVLEPNAWPAVNDTDHHSFDRNKHKLTERQ